MSRRGRGAELEILAQQIVGQLSEKIVASMQEIRSQMGLSFSQVIVIDLLGKIGPMRLGQVASHLGITSGSATPLVDGLENKGLVERHTDPSDRRAILVTLSTKGEELIELAHSSWTVFLGELLERVRPETVEDLVAALESLGLFDRSEATVANGSGQPGRAAARLQR